AKTVKDAFPVPLIEDILNACQDADWYSVLDIKDAYHHIRMHPESEPMTAFVTPDGLFHWKRMPFGLCNAPGTFNRYLSQQLRAPPSLIGRKCQQFFDDVAVYTKGSFEQHVLDVEEVLRRLAAVNMEVSVSKSR